MFRETEENGIGEEIGFDEEGVHVPIDRRFREHRVFYDFQIFLMWYHTEGCGTY